jgi:hypothetical protein
MITSTVEKYGEKINVISYAADECTYNKKGYPFCSCNNCLKAISEYGGFKMGGVYSYKGKKVVVISFCPFESCCDIFISGKGEQGFWSPDFCEWLTIPEARKELTLVSCVQPNDDGGNTV